MNEFIVLRVVTKALIPFILLFGLYVQTHGDFGPGGGFQAGVIFASAFILYGLVFGISETRRVFPSRLLLLLAALGVLIFAGVGVVALFMGGNYLEYAVLAGDPAFGNHIGIWLVELGVGMTVSSVMVTIFVSFADFRTATGGSR
ncbi:MAG: Na(+)/H(+) antiporter subunit B [Proteobacteria bacterium]|nr:Na(+)/H(+) antiporter subunit B [Pseudomonadota bacterium]